MVLSAIDGHSHAEASLKVHNELLLRWIEAHRFSIRMVIPGRYNQKSHSAHTSPTQTRSLRLAIEMHKDIEIPEFAHEQVR